MRSRTGSRGRRTCLGLSTLLLATSTFFPSKISGQLPLRLLDRIVGVEFVDVSLEEALNQIRRNTGIGLVYSPDLVPGDRRVACPCTDRTVGEALELILRGTNLTFAATETQVRIIPQERPTVRSTVGSIGGVVTNGTDGFPVPNVFVELSDGRGTLSNDHGRFIMVNVPPGTYSLQVTGLGWEPAEIPTVVVEAGGTTAVDVALVRRAIPLSAIVVSPGTFGILDEVSDFALQTITREQIQTVPQVGEDVFRSLKRLPGVASGDISTRLHLRGGTDREVLVMLDGLELYEPYHLKDFEGALGIVDINAVGGIDLHTGGFGVDFGNYMAGVFSMDTRVPPTEGTRTTLGLSLTNATAMSQGGFADGKGQWLFSARRGYMDIVLKFTNANDDLSPKYYDLLGKVKYQLGSKHLLSANFLHAGDDLTLSPEGFNDDGVTGHLGTNYGNTYGWLTWKAFFSPRVRAQTVVSAGRITESRIGNEEEPGRVEGPEGVDVHDILGFDFAGLKQEWTVDFTDRIATRAGFSLKKVAADYDYNHWTRTLRAQPNGDLVGVYDTAQVVMKPEGTEFGAFGAFRFQPLQRVIGEVGLRYDRYTHTGDSDLSPRIHAVVNLREGTSLRAAWGQYHQSQGIHQLEAPDNETTFSRSERATQVALGLEHDLGNGFSGRIEVYNRRIDRPLRQYFNRWREILPFPEIDGDRIRLDPTEARAKGMEILAQHVGATWDWSASYSLSSTEDLVDGDWTPRFIDQRHAVTVTTGFHPSPAWTVTAAWQAHSGWPFTPQVIQFDTITVFQDEGLGSYLRWRQEFGPLNSSRLPAYHRLDLRVTRRFETDRGALDVYLDLFNAYNQENLRSYTYGTTTVGRDLKYMRWPDETLLPILPSIGLRWEF